jgi:hypothetical protein
MLIKFLVKLFFFSFFMMILLISSCATRGKYETADVEIDPGYDNPGVLKLSVDLIKANGSRKHLKPGWNFIKWSQFKFSSSELFRVRNGYLHYRIKDITKDNCKFDINVFSKKYAVNKSLIVQVPYVKSLDLVTSSIQLNIPEQLDYELILDDGKRISKNKKYFTLDNTILISNVNLKLKKETIVLESKVPVAEDPKIVLLNKNNKETLCNSRITIQYPDFKSYDFSGKSGKKENSIVKSSKTTQSLVDGKKGDNGSNGRDVYVDAKYYKANNKEFIILSIESTGGFREVVFLKKNNARLSIKTNGGDGGNGGDGKENVTSSPSNQNTNTKQDVLKIKTSANGGDGGNGGNGGNVYLNLDRELFLFRGNINIENTGGKPGKGGKHWLSGRYGSDGYPGKNGRIIEKK